MEKKFFILLAAAILQAGSLDENGNARLDNAECAKRAHELWDTLVANHGDGILTPAQREEHLKKNKG